MYAVVTLKYDPAQPRGKGGRWIKVGEQIAALKAKYPGVAKQYPRSSYTEMGSIESHTTDVGREWEKQLSHEELAGISDRFGSDVEKVMASAIALHDIGKAEAIEEGEGKFAQHKHTIPILQTVLRDEGFSEQDVSLVTELMNHDLIGPLFRRRGTDREVAEKLTEKAEKVGMSVADFATLQLAFYQADAAAYPYITQFMTQEPSGKWTFTGRPQIAAIEALTRVRKFDPNQPRNPKGSPTGGEFKSSGVPRDAQGMLLDKTGQPLTVYHGSVARDIDITMLDPAREPVRPRPGQLNGIYFTSDQRAAGGYVRPARAGIKVPAGRVLAAHLVMKNPLDITKAIKAGRKKGLSFGDAKREALKAVTPDHDGVVFRGDAYNADEYLVFSQSQIRAVQPIAPKFVEVLKYSPDQLRDNQGRFTEEGVTADLLRTIRKPDGGFTYKPTTKSSPTTGFMVSIYKSREKILDVGEVTGVVLAAYVRKNRDLLQKSNNYLGAWHNPENGKVYLDVSRRTESRDEAARFGKAHDQEAYFDIVAGRSVDLKKNKKKKAHDGSKTLAQINWRSHAGGSDPVDEAIDRQRPDTEGDRADEKNSRILKFDESKHPRDKDGRFVDAHGVTHVGEFVELYHGTSRRRANKILKEGFKIRAVAKPTMGGDPPESRNYIWLAKRPESAKMYSELHLNPTVLTVRLPVGEYEKLRVRNSGPDSVWSREIIPAKYVALKYDPNQPRDPKGTSTGGQFKKTTGRTFTSEEGFQWHEKGPVAEWAKTLPHEHAKALDDYAGFGYHDVNDLRRGTYKVPIKDHFVRAATPEEMRRVGWDVERNEWVPSIKVKEGQYKTGYPVDPRDEITPESIERFGHPMGKTTPRDFDPDDPYHRVDDGRIVINQYYRPVPGGPPMMFSIQRAGPDLERLAQVQKAADKLDEAIGVHGYELPEAITVERGAYLPGVSMEDLQAMAEDGRVWEEKGLTSTMVGDAGGRATSYPALGKWESITHRHGSASGVLVKHQDEVGTAVRFHIVLPEGTKVASVEATRRLRYEYPRIPNPEPMGPKELADPFWQQHPELWQVTDYTQAPTVDAKDLDAGKEGRRTESEVLLGSGAQFRVVRVKQGETYRTGDPTLHDVPIVEVYLEYIGGGSSEGAKH